jgi:hypothetical protein
MPTEPDARDVEYATRLLRAVLDADPLRRFVNSEEGREAIARMRDPEAWEEYDHTPAPAHTWAEKIVEPSFAFADALIALLAQAAS